MKISDILAENRPTLSFEVFPPKIADDFDKIRTAVNAIANLKPDFMSVTYGAGGSTSRFTAEIASDIEAKGVTALAHLTCVNAGKESLDAQLIKLKELGIQNILSLRGDLPEGIKSTDDWVFKHANELIPVIRQHGDFCIGGACYPETHPEAACSAEDIENLKKKVDAGLSFLTSQMFFDNDLFYNFLFRIRSAGINVPVAAGIMPVTNSKMMTRILKLSNACVPHKFARLLDRFGNDPKAMESAGIAYATEQIVDLVSSGVNNIHVYTMNKPEIAAAIQKNLAGIIPARC